MVPPPETKLAPDIPDAIRFQRYRFVFPDGSRRVFDRRVLHLGADETNDLVVVDPTVSRVHARLEHDGRGYRVTDLDSKNGTRINGVRIDQGYLEHGSALRLGTAELTFVTEEEAVEVALATERQLGDLVGESSQMREIFAILHQVAPRDVTVLVEGESGTGKELVARAIHAQSGRATRPLVVFDCSAVAPNLIESELFGHVEGAFTGAVDDRRGVFELADGGTLFLDEIGELPRDMQPKLLRVLESGQVRPVGGSEVRQTDVRLVAATNRRLDEEVKTGTFREDLFFRLAVLRVRIPPLRQRPEDIPGLVAHFLRDSGREDLQIGYETMAKLQAHPWPGNVRELKNYIDRALALSDDDQLPAVPLDLLGADDDRGLNLGQALSQPYKEAKGELLEEFERRYWSALLDETGWNISEAARRGGIHRKSVEYLVRKLGLKPAE